MSAGASASGDTEPIFTSCSAWGGSVGRGAVAVVGEPRAAGTLAAGAGAAAGRSAAPPLQPRLPASRRAIVSASHAAGGSGRRALTGECLPGRLAYRPSVGLGPIL